MESTIPGWPGLPLRDRAFCPTPTHLSSDSRSGKLFSALSGNTFCCTLERWMNKRLFLSIHMFTAHKYSSSSECLCSGPSLCMCVCVCVCVCVCMCVCVCVPRWHKYTCMLKLNSSLLDLLTAKINGNGAFLSSFLPQSPCFAGASVQLAHQVTPLQVGSSETRLALC